LTTDEHAKTTAERSGNRVGKETIEEYNKTSFAWQLVLQMLGRMTSILITAGLDSLIFHLFGMRDLLRHNLSRG
jgi:hypothetical protein